MKKLGFVCGWYLSEKAKTDSSIWVLDGDLADSDGAEEFMLQYPQRFIAGGIAEQNMVSMAAGMATTQLRPWVFSFASFLCYRAYDQIRICIAQTGLPVVLVGSHSGGCSGRNGKTHTALNDIAVMSSLPKINIWAPADENDTKLAIDRIINSKQPAYLRFPRDIPSPIPQSTEEIRWIGKPTKIAFISYGLSTNWAIEAQQILIEKGIEIGILHFCKVWPLELAKISKMLEGIKSAFVIEDHYATGGLASILSNYKFNIKLHNICWPSEWSGQSGESSTILDYFCLSPNQIADKISTYLSKN